MFKPYVIKELKGIRVAIIGQAFPYSTIANPAYNMPDWTFQLILKICNQLSIELKK